MLQLVLELLVLPLWMLGWLCKAAFTVLGFWVIGSFVKCCCRR